MSRTDPRLFITLALDILAHPKFEGATPAAKWAFVASMVVSKRDLSDGVVRPSVVYAEAEVTARAGAELLRRALWHEPGHGCEKCPQPPPGRVIVHDYLEHQTSRAKVEEMHRRKSEAGRLGAAARWGDGSSHGTSHSTSHGRTDGTPIAEQWPESESETDSVVNPPSRQSSAPGPAAIDDAGLTRIQTITGGNRTHAERVVRDILSRATEAPKRPLAYVLRAIGAEPDRYKATARGVTKAELCQVPGHTDKAVGCKQCASERLGGDR